MSVSDTECKDYAESLGKTWGGRKDWNGVAQGCNIYSGSTIYYITQTSHPNNKCDVNLPNYNCLEKLPNYFRKGIRTPDGSLSELGCKKYAVRMGIPWDTLGSTNLDKMPSGCIVSTGNNAVRYNPGASERECGDHYGGISTNHIWHCVEISPCGACASGKYGKAYDLLSYIPLTSGQMINSVTEEECKQIAVEDTTIRRNALSTRYYAIDTGTLPSGCLQTFGYTFVRTPRDNNDVAFTNPANGEMWLYNYNTQSTSIACSASNICITKAPMDYIEVNYGAPATFGVHVTSNSQPAVEGSPEWMSETECEQYKIDYGYSHFFTQTSTGRPEGCWLYVTGSSAQIYWNYESYVATADMKCTALQPCIQKSPTAHAYVTQSECEALSPYGGAWQAGSGTFPVGCISNGATYYWNPDFDGDAGTACGSSSWNCVQKRPATSPVSVCHECSLGKFTLSKEHLIPKATGSPSLSVSPEECEAFARKMGMEFSMLDFTIPWMMIIGVIHRDV